MKSNIYAHKKNTTKFLIIAVALLTVLATLGIGYTLAAPADIEVTLGPESGISSTYTVEVGQTKSLTAMNLNEASSSDLSLATVDYTSGSSLGNVRVTGVKAGVVAIAYGTSEGIVSTARYQVTDSRNISAYTLSEGGEVKFSAPGSTKPSPVKAIVGTNNIRWSSSNTYVASVDAGNGAITSTGFGAAIIIGEFTDKWGIARDMHVLAIVGDVNGGGTGTGELIHGEDGNWYKPVGQPPNVYEKVDEDGNSLTEPPEYVYNPDGQPGNGNDQEALKDDNKYYVEDPENIWTPVGPDGNLNEEGAIWGGPNGKPGGGDDKPVGNFGGNHWVSMGQNVWKEVLGPFTLGELTGGGPDGDPSTDPVTPIYEDSNGKYYVGPFNDGDGDYYYGDPVGGNGTLDSTADGLEKDDVIYYKDSNGNMTTTKPSKPIVDKPTIAPGRELTTDKTGDDVKWIEIATNGDYSLIVRSDYINVLGNNKGNPLFQAPPFGSNNNYVGSNIQRMINDWFNGSSDGDNLSGSARLRNFTVTNNAVDKLGTGCSETGGLDDGYSKPTGQAAKTGNGISFALSFGEAANFISKEYATTFTGGNYANSSATAVANYGKLALQDPAYGVWLRSPGTNAGAASSIHFATGRVFQFMTTNVQGLVYPALWVHSDIFN